MPSARVSSCLGAAVAAALLVGSTDRHVRAAVGQLPLSPQQFGTRTDLIQLDVSVIDKNHQPVRGLTAADFTVLEGGKPQVIQAFAAIDLPDNPPQIPGWMQDVAPDVTSNTGVDEERLIVIVMDDFAEDVDKDLWAQKSAKEIGRGVVERLGPHDLAAVVYTIASENNQEFTHDRARLLAAVDKFNPGGNVPRMSMPVLARVCDVLASVPQRRKALIWITPGVVPPGSAGFVTAAQLANVNVYPIDPAGIRVPMDPPPAGFNGATSTDDSFRQNVERTNNRDRLNYMQDVLVGTAVRTGGHAFQWNEFKKSLNQVFRETGSFYLLGYVSSDKAPDDRFRKQEVKVNRRGVTVNARDGYFPDRSEYLAHLGSSQTSPAIAALSGLVPTRGVAVRIAAAPFATEGMPAVAVALGLPAPVDGPDDVDIVLKAFTFDGNLKETRNLHAHVEAGASPTEESRAEIVDRLDLPPGRYQLRAGVTSVRHKTSGSVYADLDVPDFANEPLSLSGVTLNAGRSSAAVVTEAIKRLVPLAPTTARSFTPASPVTATIEVYQGAKNPIHSVSLNVTVRDSAEKVVFNQTETIDATRFEAERRVQTGRFLPLTALKPGEYLLTFEAKAGKTSVRRDVRFAVR